MKATKKETMGIFKSGFPALSKKPDSDASEVSELSNRIMPGKEKRYSAKQVIYHEGDHVDKVFVIRKGMVKLLSYLVNGRARIVRLHVHDHWLGLEGLVGQPYEHTAVAVDYVVVTYVSMSDLCLLEQTAPSQYCQLLKHGYRHLHQADIWISDFSTGGIKARVARLVNFLAQLEYGVSAHRVDLLTVHEMAEMLGVTPESVSRILAEFKRNETLQKVRGNADETYEIDFRRLYEIAQQ